MSLRPRWWFLQIFIPPVSIKLNDLSVQCVYQFKYLGNWLESKSRFQSHLDALHRRFLHYHCAMSVRLGHLMSLISAKNFYFTFIFSAILYCILVWGKIFRSSIKEDRILRLQQHIILNLFSSAVSTIMKWFYISYILHKSMAYINSIYWFLHVQSYQIRFFSTMRIS